MSNQLKLSGMVLYSAPAGEYDKRVVLLTKERGKITAFARGARRPRSPLAAVTRQFACGTFELYEGRSSYTLAGASIWNYFPALSTDLDGSFYGSYFLELAGYYTRENLEAGDTLNLLFVTLQALENAAIDDRLVRCIYEIRLMVIHGEYPQDAVNDPSLGEAARYAMQCAIRSPLKGLYSFTVSEETICQMAAVQDKIRRTLIDRPIKSLEVLESVLL